MSRCRECGVGPHAKHKDGCHRDLELAADRILMEDRRENCTSISCKQHFYIDHQLKLRDKRDIPSGLKP